MPGHIYLIQDNHTLLEMGETAYDTEDLLQSHLADYPDLLAGDQINSAEPRRWLLVAREVSLPGDDTGGGRWSVDHLFLDQDGIPTIVEVKRSTDTRIRREVVGQMLEYAANAVAYWSIESLRTLFESNCASRLKDPKSFLAESLGVVDDYEQFWQTVKTNLQAGKVRMIFVADQIPAELQRIVEFLSRQLDPAEVFAIEVKKFSGNDLNALVPRVVGKTASSPNPPSVKWNAQTIANELLTRNGQTEAGVFSKILEWVNARSLKPTYGKGKIDGSFYAILVHDGQTHWTFTVWTDGTVAVQFGDMLDQPPFDSEKQRLELLRRLNAIPGITIEKEKITKYPSFPLSTLARPESLAQFLDTFDWYVLQVRSASASIGDQDFLIP